MTRCERLVQEATRGDAAAVEALIERNLPALRAFVRLRVGDLLRAKEDSMDFVQSACREVLQDLDGFDWRDEDHFRNWLFQTALRKLQDRAKFYGRQRRDAAREQPLEHGALGRADLLACYASLFTPSREAVAQEELERFEDAFAQLSDRHREVITLAKIVGLSRAQVGVELGIAEDAARSLLHRALARLTSLLRGQP